MEKIQNIALDELIKDLKEFLKLSFQEDDSSVQDWINERVNKLGLKCWEIRQCGEVDCPAYEHECSRCWLIAGTVCDGNIQGKFTEKYIGCTECEVYMDTFGDDRVRELRELTIALIHTLRLEKASLEKAMADLRLYNDQLSEAHQELQSANKELKMMKKALENKNRLLQELSITDRLTALYNRGYIEDVLQAEIRRIERYGGVISLIIADIDNFKQFNDNFGHQVGDQVLGKVSDALRKHVRKTDTVGRWGGEEFVILCPNSSEHEAFTLAEKLRSIIEATEHNIFGRVTCSFGVAELTSGKNEYELVKDADTALYESKKAGRNRSTRASKLIEVTSRIKVANVASSKNM